MIQIKPKLPVSSVDEFQANGAVLLRGLFQEWIEPLSIGIEKAIADPSSRQRSYETDSDKAGFFNDFCNWQRIQELNDFVLQSGAAKIAAQLMQSRHGQFFHDHILVKEPGASTVTPWHQDAPYYCVSSERSVSFWLTLDEIDKDRAIEFVAGSHRWGKHYKPQRFDGSDLFANDNGEAVPDINSNRENLTLLQWKMEPGDVAAFHFNTIHSAPANNSEKRRRAISTRWVGDGATFIRRKGKTSPDFPELRYQSGDPFIGDDFPVVYSSTSESSGAN